MEGMARIWKDFHEKQNPVVMDQDSGKSVLGCDSNFMNIVASGDWAFSDGSESDVWLGGSWGFQ